MFIVSKEVMKDIVEFGEKWQKNIKNGDSLLALMAFFLAPVFIFLIIFAFLGDIVFSPLEIIIYLAVRRIKRKQCNNLI